MTKAEYLAICSQRWDDILQGYMIGSGAIESAHKTVIQRRMKLSGQRWSMKGAKNMLNLRCVALSGHWDWVEQHCRKAAA